MLKNIVISIYQTIKEIISIILKLWQVIAIINMIYNPKNVLILASTSSDKSLP